jgi:hypothetical protein
MNKTFISCLKIKTTQLISLSKYAIKIFVKKLIPKILDKTKTNDKYFMEISLIITN